MENYDNSLIKCCAFTFILFIYLFIYLFILFILLCLFVLFVWNVCSIFFFLSSLLFYFNFEIKIPNIIVSYHMVS